MSDDEVDMTDVRRDGRPAVVEEDGRPYVEGTFTEKNIVPSFRYRRTPAFSRDGGTMADRPQSGPNSSGSSRRSTRRNVNTPRTSARSAI